MHVQDLDTTDPATLEAQLEAAPLLTLARVETAGGETLTVQRVEGGWHLPGDMAVSSADVAEGRPRAVSLLLDEDYRGEWLFGDDPYDERDHQ